MISNNDKEILSLLDIAYKNGDITNIEYMNLITLVEHNVINNSAIDIDIDMG